MKTALIITAVIALLIIIIEWVRNYNKLKGMEYQGLYITNSDMIQDFPALIFLLVFIGYALVISDYVEAISLEKRYALGIAGNIIIALCALVRHNFLKRQYVFDGRNIYRMDKEQEKLPYSVVNALYIGSRRTEDMKNPAPEKWVVFVFINKKRYKLILNMVDYNIIKQRVHPIVRKNAEIVDGKTMNSEKYFKSNQIAAAVITLIICIVIIFSVLLHLNAGQMTVVTVSCLIFALIAIVIWCYVANYEINAIVKKMIDGDLDNIQ